MSKKSESKAERLAGRMIIIVCTGILLVPIAALAPYMIKFSGSLADSPAEFGQFGDYFGGTLNPLFSVLTLFVLLVTLSLQRHEIKLARDALKMSYDQLDLNRRELEITKEELARSSDTQETLRDSSTAQIEQLRRQTASSEMVQAITQIEDVITQIGKRHVAVRANGEDHKLTAGRVFDFGDRGLRLGSVEKEVQEEETNKTIVLQMDMNQEKLKESSKDKLTVWGIAHAVYQLALILDSYTPEIGSTQLWKYYVSRYCGLAQDCDELKLFSDSQRSFVERTFLSEPITT